MPLSQETHKIQSSLARYCRTGKFQPIEGADDVRLGQYRRLVFNILMNTMSRAFPIAKKQMSEEQWAELLNDYYTNHDCKENRVWRMPFELCTFVEENNYAEKYELPYLVDLMYFEWIEIDVHTMADEPYPNCKKDGNVWQDVLAINPEFVLSIFEYPVHLKKPADITSNDKGNYYMLAYRELESGKVKLLNLSVLYAYVVEQIQEGLSLEKITQNAIQLFKVKDEEKLREQMLLFIDKLKQKEFVLGFLV